MNLHEQHGHIRGQARSIRLWKLKTSSTDVRSFGVNLIVSAPGPEGVAGGNLLTSQPASCNVNSRSFCHPTFGLSVLPVSQSQPRLRVSISSCRHTAVQMLLRTGQLHGRGHKVTDCLCVSLSWWHILSKP